MGVSNGTGSKLLVQGSIETGAPITFFADGERAESYDVMAGGPWMPTYPYSEGGVTNLNLRVQNVTPTAPPVTDFVADKTSGMAPLSVGFTDTSSNKPTSWNWNFGDGSTSTVKNPAHVYTTPGVYTVNLSATNNVGTGFVSKGGFISVAATGPVADFAANSTAGPPPLTVGFTDTVIEFAHFMVMELWRREYFSREEPCAHLYRGRCLHGDPFRDQSGRV